MKTAYPIILTPAQRGYVVTVPDLEINTEGETLADAISMAEDAIGLWGVTAQDLGREIPPPSAQLPACGDEEIAAFAVVDFAEAYQRLATHPDPFYSAENLSHLRRAIADLDAGRGTPHDLIAVAMRDEYNIPELNPRANPYVKGSKKQAGFVEDYKRTADSDTQYLSSIPGMVDSIKAAQREPVEECAPYDPNENW